MSDTSQGEGWWQASDGKWYPPEQAATATPAEPAEPPVGTWGAGTAVGAAGSMGVVGSPGAPHAPGTPGAPVGPGVMSGPGAPGWWQASDGNWYPPEQAAGAPAVGAYPAVSPDYGGGYNPNLDPQAKSKMIAGILGILLGGFGAHRFYLGYTSIGIIQIVVTLVTCGFGAIWGLVEGILILVGHDSFRTDAEGRPLKDN
jgi:TM2 domain-containing membrane protein YozV